MRRLNILALAVAVTALLAACGSADTSALTGKDWQLTAITEKNPAFLGVILQEKTIKGCWYGSSNVQKDVPKLIDLYKKGELKLDELISREITLDEVNDAFEAMKTGEVARSVIVYPS